MTTHEQELKAEIEGCEFCGIKENCTNYKLGIEEGRAEMLKEILDEIDKIEFTNILRRNDPPNDTMDKIKNLIKQKLQEKQQ